MNRMFRNERPGWPDYTGLALFLIAYLAIIGVIVAPEGTLTTRDALHQSD